MAKRREEYQLRHLRETDLEMVLAWRNADHIRSYMYSDHIITMAEHRAWFARLTQEQKTICLVCEHRGIAFGVVNINQWDQSNKRCHWGFYVGDTSVPRGSGTVMGFLALEYMFETLKLHKVCGEVFDFNTQSIHYHQRLGFLEEGCFVEHVQKNGQYHDIIALAVLQKNWLGIKAKLQRLCFDSEVTI